MSLACRWHSCEKIARQINYNVRRSGTSDVHGDYAIRSKGECGKERYPQFSPISRSQNALARVQQRAFPRVDGLGGLTSEAGIALDALVVAAYPEHFASSSGHFTFGLRTDVGLGSSDGSVAQIFAGNVGRVLVNLLGFLGASILFLSGCCCFLYNDTHQQVALSRLVKGNTTA